METRLLKQTHTPLTSEIRRLKIRISKVFAVRPLPVLQPISLYIIVLKILCAYMFGVDHNWILQAWFLQWHLSSGLLYLFAEAAGLHFLWGFGFRFVAIWPRDVGLAAGLPGCHSTQSWHQMSTHPHSLQHHPPTPQKKICNEGREHSQWKQGLLLLM